MIVGSPLPALDKVTDAGAPGATERLAWDASGDEIHGSDTPGPQFVEEIGRVGQIPAPAKSGDVGFVTPHSPLFGVGTNQHVKAGPLKTE